MVALLAEGVDRNLDDEDLALVEVVVALLAEGVDRNELVSSVEQFAVSRPPRGGRG